ncbi:MAG: 3-dehydroquinate synthase, partial [Helicobacter sp.]|nr:3-dehydroquinate synthase [Helicobacter sp.]
IDTQFLKTLPSREFRAGIAEMIKMAICFDENFFNILKNAVFLQDEILLNCIYQSLKIKAKVVEEDEKEKGVRAALNYGHTFGHIIEQEGNYTQYLHGEAVSMGMVMANALALELGLLTQVQFQDILEALKSNHLPTNYILKDVDSFYQSFFLDKKCLHNKLKFILPKGIGSFIIKDDIPKEVLIKVLKGFCKCY